MATIDQARGEIKAAIATLRRRHGSTADAAEKATIADAVQELDDQLSLLNQAALLEVANSVAAATTTLEKAVGAARLGPFDGYLAALEGHLTKLNKLAGKVHDTDSLESAVVKPAKRSTKSRKRGRKKAADEQLESLTPGLLTSTVFADLAAEYQDCFDRCEINPAFNDNVTFYLNRIRRGKPNYQLVEQALGVPWLFVGIIHGMECGFNFAGHMHNGDPLTARTVQVPKGFPKTGTPPFTWLESALDALRLKKFDQERDWSIPHMLYLLEGYNGFGYRRRGLPSPYLWSFSNIYSKGKFVKDGKFDPEAVSKQCGAGLMLKRMQGG